MSPTNKTWRGIQGYGRLLKKLEFQLSKYGDAGWSSTLKSWIAEFDELDRIHGPIGTFEKHLSRTRQAFGGMGSLNDIAISERSVHGLCKGFKARKANARLRDILASLYSETNRLLEEIAE